VPALTTALADAPVVISTTSLMALDAQVPVAQAAKAAGVSLFLLSEYGGPTDNLEGLQLWEVGPPLLLVYTGPFADYVVTTQCVPFMVSFPRG
jgi:hypothetical protein